MWQNWQRIIKEEAEKHGYGQEEILREGAMKDAMHDWMDALPKAAVDELLKAKKKLTDEKMLGKSYLETLKKYNIKPLLARAGDHRESVGALLCCLDTFHGESVEADGTEITEAPSVSVKKIRRMEYGDQTIYQLGENYYVVSTQTNKTVVMNSDMNGDVSNYNEVLSHRGKVDHDTVIGEYAKTIPTTEETKKLDELSKPTLARYIKQANQVSGTQSWKAGVHSADQTPRNASARREAAIKAMKRDKGIGRAADKLAREEVTEARAGVMNGWDREDKIIGRFVHANTGKVFDYRLSNDAWGKSHGYPHEVCVGPAGDQVRAAKVMTTVCYIVVDEEGNKPVVEKWNIKNHKKWMKYESVEEVVTEATASSKVRFKLDNKPLMILSVPTIGAKQAVKDWIENGILPKKAMSSNYYEKDRGQKYNKAQERSASIIAKSESVEQVTEAKEAPKITEKMIRDDMGLGQSDIGKGALMVLRSGWCANCDKAWYAVVFLAKNRVWWGEISAGDRNATYTNMGKRNLHSPALAKFDAPGKWKDTTGQKYVPVTDSVEVDGESIEEVKAPTGKLGDACWKGYTAVGTKKKGGRTVPNCVPMKDSVEVDAESIEEAVKRKYTTQQRAALKSYRMYCDMRDRDDNTPDAYRSYEKKANEAAEVCKKLGLTKDDGVYVTEESYTPDAEGVTEAQTPARKKRLAERIRELKNIMRTRPNAWTKSDLDHLEETDADEKADKINTFDTRGKIVKEAKNIMGVKINTATDAKGNATHYPSGVKKWKFQGVTTAKDGAEAVKKARETANARMQVAWQKRNDEELKKRGYVLKNGVWEMPSHGAVNKEEVENITEAIFKIGKLTFSSFKNGSIDGYWVKTSKDNTLGWVEIRKSTASSSIPCYLWLEKGNGEENEKALSIWPGDSAPRNPSSTNVKNPQGYSVNGTLQAVEKWISKSRPDLLESEELPMWKDLVEESTRQASAVADDIKKAAAARGVRITVSSSSMFTCTKEFKAGDQNEFFKAYADCNVIRSMVHFKSETNEWGCSTSGIGLGAQSCIKNGVALLHKSGKGGAYVLAALGKK